MTRDTCFPAGLTHITRDMCFPAGGTHISRDKCISCISYISLGICVPCWGTHITWDTCFPCKKTPVTRLFFPLFLGNIGQENVFYDILERKNAFLGYKNKKFNSRKIDIFSFWSKIGHFSTLFF